MTTAEQERAYWDDLAGDPVNMGGGPTMPDLDHYLDILERCWKPLWFGQEPADLLELGCGIGRLLVPMADQHPDDMFHGVDISVHMAAQVPTRPNVVVHVGDGRTIPGEIDEVKFVWSVLMFQHITHPTQAGYLRQITDRLTRGGRFVLQWVTAGDRHDYSYPTPTLPMLRWAESAGLEVVEVWRDTLVDQWMWAVWEKP